MHHIQRKPSNETLASVGMDSTLDSRMSSAEVPQMELLKVNYVHQCKEAFMTKTGSAPNYSYMEYKKSLPPIPVPGQRKNVARITVNRHEAPNKPLPPPPPPTVESWQFLQSTPKRTTNSPPKYIKPPPQAIERFTDSPSSCCHSSSCDTGCDSDNTVSGEGEGVKSNSWDYRNRIATCDVRRDIARAGIKSRADRIARIERTECEHGPNSGKPNHTPTTTTTSTTPKEAVAKINKMFEQQKHKQILPPQPKRPAPVPHKEPNRRLKPLPSLPEDQVRFKQSLSINSECAECLSAQETATNSSCSEASCIQNSALRYRRSESKERKSISRIPKPIQEPRSSAAHRITEPFPKTSSFQASKTADKLNEVASNERHAVAPNERHSLASNERHSVAPNERHAVASNERHAVAPNERHSGASNERHSGASNHERHSVAPTLERHSVAATDHHQLLRNTRVAGGQYQKAKVERVHIRKKRQPLLIINQLNEPAKRTEEEEEAKLERLTCGYKNCNFSNCPMSKSQHDLHQLGDGEEDDKKLKLKRLSLESNSDSGVSSSNDDHKKSAGHLKNLERCSDSGKTNSKTKASTKSEHFDDYAYDKFKVLSKDFEDQADCSPKTSANSQIKIQVGKSITSFSGHYNTADPNDVTNFAKKNLTKATTNEALNNSMAKSGISATISSSNSSTKQCNIENEQRLKIQNNLQESVKNLTKIKIDDDWVMDGAAGEHEEDGLEADSLMITELPLKKPLNTHTHDNSVKIFVRSSTQNIHDLTRSSCLSANSFVSQTSVCTDHSSSAHSSCSSVSCCSSSTSSSGCSASSHADSQSLCDSERDCCCQFSNANGMFFHRPSSVISEEQRACAGSPLSSTDAISDISCVTCSTAQSTVVVAAAAHAPLVNAKTAACCNTDSGIFWNNSYTSIDGQDASDLPCCCSLSSCDEDNCSYYEGEQGNGGGGGSSSRTGDNIKIEITHSYQEQRGPKQHQQQLQSRTQSRHQAPLQQQQPQQPPQLPKRNVRLSSGEEILIRNQLLRKTDVIHELRPRSMDCAVDSGVSLNGDNDAGESQQDMEARRLKRGHVLSELLETERIYVSEMSSILKGYCDQMHSEEMIHLVPASLQGKEDLLFGNLHELYTFHNDVFLKDLENCISTTELVALCFVQRRDTFYRLYSFYCQNIPRSDRLRETLVDTHLFLQECQKRLGHKLPLAAYLLKPVQRITKYQLLLKDLLRFSDNGSCTKELQKALDCMLIVLKCVNDSMHQVAITGFPTDLSQQGELLLQDSFQIWSESKKDIRLRIKPQQRHIFLYQKSMLFCKQTSKPGHNKSTYQFKHYLKMSQIGLTESVRGDAKRFEVWLQGRQEVHTLQAPTLDIKNKWVADIKKVLLLQLEELKGEKIKQYGLNHRGLRQTTSWDTPNILLGNPGRTISCDASSESSNRNSNCSSSDDNCTTISLGSGLPISSNVSMISGMTTNTATTTDKEHNTEACGWSSDYSNSEDEMSLAEDNSSTPMPMPKVGPPRRTWNQSIENLLDHLAGTKTA